MSEETPDQSSDQPEIWSPIQPKGNGVPFMSEELAEAPAAPGFAAPVAPSAAPVAPSYVDVAKRRSPWGLLKAMSETYRENPRTILGMSAFIAVITTLLETALMVTVALAAPQLGRSYGELHSNSFDALNFDSLSDSQIATLISVFALSVLITVGMSLAKIGFYWEFVAPRNEDEAAPIFDDVFHAWAKKLPRMLSATFWWLLGYLLIASVVIASAVIVYAFSDTLTWLIIVFAVVGVVAVIWYLVASALTPYIVQSTELSGRASLMRSIALVRGAWWRTWAAMFVLNIFAALFASTLTRLLVPVGALVDDQSHISWGFIFTASASTFVGSLISTPISAIGLAHYYRDRSDS